MKWHYRVKAPNEKVRDPIQGEFFTTQAIKNTADALVRESIQNALDATIKDTNGNPTEVLAVRFFLATGHNALPSQKVAQWFDGGWEHLQAAGNGLLDRPEKNEPCPWLVIEDFGTTGLEGDVKQSEPDGKENHFFSFFRAEGKTVEGGKERGRWGIGKYVFPRSSRANTFFGLSVRRNDQQRILLGASIFKSHRLGDKYFCPDGYWGKQDTSELVVPIIDDTILNEFSNTFQLARKNEPGLSVVIPWIDSEITAPALTEAVVRGYFYPILQGELSVTIATPDKTAVIDKSSLDSAALTLDSKDSDELLGVVDLAQWATTAAPTETLILKACAPERPSWADELIPADQITSLRHSLANGNKIAVRASLTVRLKEAEPVQSHFDFFLWRNGFDKGTPIFIRQGLNIADVRAPRSRGIRSIVVVGRGALGNLLGDAENPAHTEWQSKGKLFHGKYTNGPAYLEFVKGAVANFVSTLTSQHEEKDQTLLLDIFSLPRESNRKKGGGTPPIKPDPPPPQPQQFSILRSPGGFTVARGSADIQLPTKLDIKCAYDTRGKNPLNVYRNSLRAQSPDFQIGTAPVTVVAEQGLEILYARNNSVQIEVLQQDFKLRVAGFDPNRDLFVTVQIEEEPHDT